MTEKSDLILIQRYLDGELDPASRGDVERRLGVDPDFDRIRRNFSELRGLALEAFPESPAVYDDERALRDVLSAISSADRQERASSWQLLKQVLARPASTALLSAAVGCLVGIVLAPSVWRVDELAYLREGHEPLWPVVPADVRELRTASSQLQLAIREREEALRLSTQGKHAEALPHAERALRAMEASVPPTDPRLLESASLVAQLKLEVEGPNEAARILREVSRRLGHE